MGGAGAGGVPFLSAADAAAVDAELMGSLGFCLEQLMELAGLSVAGACACLYVCVCVLIASANSPAPVAESSS